MLAVFTFLAGLVLLFSGATPAAAGRLELLDRILPSGLIEASHFLSSVAGAALLILSQGLARRLDAAYYLTAITIAHGHGGVSAERTRLRGGGAPAAGLRWCCGGRGRRSIAGPPFSTRASPRRGLPQWPARLAASVWLGLFAFKHVDYSHQLWWQFEIQGEASRSLRASVGAALVLLLFGLARLIGYAPHEAPTPGDADLEDAGRAIAAQTATFPYLVYLRDKAVLFDDDRTAFVMYGVQGRTWVALGDPVGPEDRLNGLIRRFLERCDDFGGVPVFYEIGKPFICIGTSTSA